MFNPRNPYPVVDPFQVSAVSSNEKTLEPIFPRFIGILLIVASIGLFVETYIAHRMGHEAEGKSIRNGKGTQSLIFLMLVVYIVAQYIGFIVGSILFGVAMMYVLGVRTWWFLSHFYWQCVSSLLCVPFLLYVHLPSFSLFQVSGRLNMWGKYCSWIC